MPVSKTYRADPQHPALGAAFFDPVTAAKFPQSIVRYRNDNWADRMGLGDLIDNEWLQYFAQFEPLPDNLSTPLALRYHGHQFQAYNPDIGDGRGFLFAQMRDIKDNRLLDLGTKGSGQTPWSRSGDGRLTLKGGVREILATEMLEALGVYTSKSFSLVETGEALIRGDEPSPTRSSVLVRLSHSHIRIGTFQRLAVLQEDKALAQLVDYCIEHYWPEAASATDPVLAFYGCAVSAIAQMAAEWHAAGFVHGVLNTDNTVITGESFDYGPWRFLPTYDPEFTAAYFDHSRLFAFGRQADALQWNLARFAECLLNLTPKQGLEAELISYSDRFSEALSAQTFARLGLVKPPDDKAKAFTVTFYKALETNDIPYERAFFDLFGGALDERIKASTSHELYRQSPWAGVIDTLRAFDPLDQVREALNHAYAKRSTPITMLIEDVEALWTSIAGLDDWDPFHAKIADIRQMRAFYASMLPPRAGHTPITDR